MTGLYAATGSRRREAAKGSRRTQAGGRVEVRAGRQGLSLRVDGTFASWYAPGRMLTGSVWDALAAPPCWLPPARRRDVLVLGLGGGSAARLVRALAPLARIVGVEWSAEVLRAARRHMGLDALGIEAVRADARDYLASSRCRFDAVIEDVFVGSARSVRKPEWMLEGGLAAAARRVRRGGLLVVNSIDETAAVARALARAGLPARLELRVEGWDNRVLVASSRALDAGTLRRRIRQSPVLAPALRRLSVRGR